MNTTSTLGGRIAATRRVRKVGQEKLAEFCGISAKHLSAIENDRSQPSVDVLTKIVQGLDASADYILNGRGTP